MAVFSNSITTKKKKPGVGTWLAQELTIAAKFPITPGREG
jgi:hypothetical protein